MKFNIDKNTTRDELIEIIMSLEHLVAQQANFLKQISANCFHAEREAGLTQDRLLNLSETARGD